MRLVAALVVSSVLIGSATAADTAPLLVFSSSKVPIVESLGNSVTLNDHAAALGSLLADEQMCDFDAVILASVPNLHISQLRGSSTTSSLLRRYRNAASSCHLPYLSYGARPETTTETTSCAMAEELARRCNAVYAQILVEDDASIALSGKDKHVLCLEVVEQKAKVENPFDILAKQVASLTELFPSHLVALSGVPTLRKRKTINNMLGSPAVHEAIATSTISTIQSPLPAESYRLLTPPLIMGFGIVFVVVVPLALVVISALAGIKSPVRESTGGKGRIIGNEKKNQ